MVQNDSEVLRKLCKDLESYKVVKIQMGIGQFCKDFKSCRIGKIQKDLDGFAEILKDTEY